MSTSMHPVKAGVLCLVKIGADKRIACCTPSWVSYWLRSKTGSTACCEGRGGGLPLNIDVMYWCFVPFCISAVSHSQRMKCSISISGCLGLPMMTPFGLALLISALKNSDFSGKVSSTIVT